MVQWDRQQIRPAQDSIDVFLNAWRRERPDLDPWPFAIFGRVNRLSTQFLKHAEEWLAPLGLGWESFSLIVTLRRAGHPFELKPRDFYRESLLSSGAVTNRIDRVEAMGLVRRRPDSKDRRGVIVCLTPAGRTLADRAIKHHFESLARTLSGFSVTERNDLARLLAKLLMAMERPVANDRPARRSQTKTRTRSGTRNAIAAKRSNSSNPVSLK